ncbi:hypothetical protein QAD02_016945 [Eretmocerus hayati]|uniref:Uncharacterized protein n=1 Tax=Eretmocerus hayati TaxID=131215 RepID=A0ACC2PCI5_9HYME|nr:hypothetical protein QAD02_016945 [Eretmocerus hayati]
MNVLNFLIQVDLLKSKVAISPSAEDESFMRIVCRAMDTNSFETAVIGRDPSTITSLRALYPVGALTNHHCVPNTRHLVDGNGRLLTYAAMDIPAGHEITMTYTELLWDTTMRRQFLSVTKHFSCRCSRCADPTEFGSMLGALNCAKDDCLGKLLPIDSMSFNSAWTCSSCELSIRSKQISAIRSGILAAIEEVLYDNPRKILRFIKRELCILIPETNYYMMDMMFRIVSLFGRVEGLAWHELTEDELNTKILYCNKLMSSLDKLGCGDCTKKGLILYELHRANAEKLKRLSAKEPNDAVDNSKEIGQSKNDEILLDAMKILKSDIVTPQDYREMYITKGIMCKI